MDVLIDCDPGIDDSVAILLALASPEELRIHAITTVSGNLQADICAANALKILDLSPATTACSIPVSRGRQTPLVRPYPRDPFSHGADGLGELGLGPSTRSIDPRFAPDLIIDTAEAVLQSSGGSSKLTLLCLGPLTNLALAVMKDPKLPEKVDRVICIAGSFGFHVTGTTRSTGDNPASEWNVYVDPEAAEIVFSAGFERLFLLGLDVATRPDVEFSAAHLARLQDAATAQGSAVAKFVLGVIDWGHRLHFDTWCTTIDSMAVAAALQPDLFQFERVRVAVETQSSLSRGQTIVDRREKFAWTHLPWVHVASDVDAAGFLGLLVDRICR